MHAVARRSTIAVAVIVILASSGCRTAQTRVGVPPPRGGYFALKPVGAWSTLPSGRTCASRVHRSGWEPRPDNTKRNNTLVNAAAVHASFAARRRDSSWVHWNDWVLPRVGGQFTGTTDEIFQWGACKWGLSDDMIRAIAANESTWYQYLTYPSGRCVYQYSCGDIIPSANADTVLYCNSIASLGHYDYQRDYRRGICPETFSIVGIKSWQAPSWGRMAGNMNGTFPFSRNSTALAVDYLGAFLRGCYEGWITWLHPAAGDIWGCVGAWYSGGWHDAGANAYIAEAKSKLARYVWLAPGWRDARPGCNQYGCPRPDQL